jgi:type II secretory ATPase GspE/PulE/Tfp pilus assembly ATPase PilB-like protein
MGLNLLAATDFGPYVAWWKVLPFLVLFFLWTRLLTWIDKDAVKVLLPRQAINSGMLVGLLLGVAAFFLLPGFGLALGLFTAAMLLTIGTYVGIRANKVGLADLRESLVEEFGSLFKGREKSEKDLIATGDFMFTPKTGPAVRNPDAEDPNRLGYEGLCQMLLDPMVKGAEAVELVPAGESSSLRYWVDGVAYDGAKLDKAAAAEGVSFAKRLAALDLDEKRKPQSGKFKLAFAGTKHDAQIKTQGNSAGESLRLELDVSKRYQYQAPQLGFTSDQLQFFNDNLDASGLVLLAMPRGMGLTTLQYAMLRTHDAFTSHILTIERDPPIEMEGITQNRLPGRASPEEEAKLTAWVTSQQPNVVLLSGIESPQSAQELIAFASNGGRAYVGVRAGDVFEAIEVWRKLVGSDAKAMSQLNYVVAGKVFRRLCDATKIPYAPDEKLLKQLGMHASKVTELYKPNTTGTIRDAKGNEVPDDICFGLGYRGRFGVYETFAIDDEVRQAVQANVGAQGLRALFRKQKRRYLQEMALSRVEIGDTSVQEFLRVLKPSDNKAPTSGSSQAPRAAPRPQA